MNEYTIRKKFPIGSKIRVINNIEDERIIRRHGNIFTVKSIERWAFFTGEDGPIEGIKYSNFLIIPDDKETWGMGVVVSSR